MQIDSLALHKVSVGLELLFLQLLWLLFFAFAPDLQLSLNTHIQTHTRHTHTQLTVRTSRLKQDTKKASEKCILNS